VGGRPSRVRDPLDERISFRFTSVLHLERGDWKIVQWHGSIPTTNEEHGFFLTKSVDDMCRGRE